ncbi:hypothetical protein AAW09_23355, partial [Escherichia coli]
KFSPTPPCRISTCISIRCNKAGSGASESEINLLDHSAIIFLIVGQEFFGGNDGYFPDVAFCFLQISPVFFEGKHRDGLKPVMMPNTTTA